MVLSEAAKHAALDAALSKAREFSHGRVQPELIHASTMAAIRAIEDHPDTRSENTPENSRGELRRNVFDNPEEDHLGG